jgi:pimeloyl-ACP methyl ester carboxylesterase
MWASQQDVLSAELRLVMPDLPGFGRSRGEAFSLDRCVGACAERLAGDDGGAVVVGLSYGGWVAVMLAAKHPDLVSALVISGVRPNVPQYLAELQAIAFRMTPARALRRGDLSTQADLKIERANLVSASRELATTDLTPSLEQVVAPTIVFAPSRDHLVRRHVALVADAIPNARLIAVPGGGHLWPIKTPTPLTECIRALTSPQRDDNAPEGH